MQDPEIHYRLDSLGSGRRRQPAIHLVSQQVCGHLPRVTRLMALAIRLEGLLAEVNGLTYSEVARLGDVSRSRVTQILNLLHLAPDLQERLLFLEPGAQGRDPILEPSLRRLTQIWDWPEQRRLFETVLATRRTPSTDPSTGDRDK